MSEMADNEPSLTEVVKQVAQHQQSQAAEIENNRELLNQFQTKLNALEIELKSVLLETKAVEKQICQEENTIENTMHLCGSLENLNYAVCAENVRLKMALETQKEDFQAIVSRNNKYRERIADHIKGFSEVENSLPVMIELIKQRDATRILKMQKEKLVRDLHDPKNSGIKQIQEETEELNEKLKEIKQLITAKRELYEKETATHAALKKEIEVQRKRYNAILKRLHCQLQKAQLSRRQYQWNIEQMQKTVTDLRENLERRKSEKV
ncbi:coiled-coil domain-containing protein 122 [Pelobates fuscus]|uniref:coiled-coil domain-containing protein 122 n=1 Tax=Pelobates fuscus TaxID=191477 RepID=UPI002FE4ADE5